MMILHENLSDAMLSRDEVIGELGVVKSECHLNHGETLTQSSHVSQKTTYVPNGIRSFV